MPVTRPKGSPKTPGSGRRAGTPNKATTARLNAMRAAVAGVAELPHEYQRRAMTFFSQLADQIINDTQATAKQIAEAYRHMETARLFARDAAQYYAAKLVRTDPDIKTGDVIVNLVQYDRTKILPTTPKPDLLEHKRSETSEVMDLDFDDPAPMPIAKSRNGGGE